MPKYLCTKATYWGRRHWNPNSRIEKDRIYTGDVAPPKNCFRLLKEGEEVPGLGRDVTRPIPLSAMVPKPPVIADDAPLGNVPVIDESVLQ